MERITLKSICDDVCLSSIYPEIVTNLKKLESLNSNYSFKIFDFNNKEIKRSFSTKESVLSDKYDIIRSILKELVFIFEKIDFNKFNSFVFSTQINNFSNFILLSNYDSNDKKWKFEIKND